MALRPDDKYAHVTLAFLLLKNGDFTEGLREFEWRLSDTSPPPAALASRWRGESLQNRSLLICSEYGFGDTLQFFRFVKLLTQSTGNITILCPQPLESLLRANTSARVIVELEPEAPLDYYISLMSLPFVFDSQLENIRAPSPYIIADPSRRNAFGKRLTGPKRFNIGLVWASGKRLGSALLMRGQKDRSIEFALLECLFTIPSCAFYNLQKDDSAVEALTAIESGRLIDWTHELPDFADNAALIANLDLVISVDTALAHLAAAMGKRVWILLNSCCDWRWLQHLDNSPWYPTAKLFRQSQLGDWQPVIERVRDELAALVHGNS